MKKILAYITEEEKEFGTTQFALLATYKTLLKIKDYEMDQEEIKKLITASEENIRGFWDDIMQKYNIPLYVDRVMRIDGENNYVYIV